MKLGDRIDGHLVQGHIDCIGEILEIKKNRNSYDFIIIFSQTPPFNSLVIDFKPQCQIDINCISTFKQSL
jgi:riboflavin synthase alpha subunit